MSFHEVAPSVRVRAPGKLNVFFAVGAVSDDGYHEVASVYQAVSLYEDLVATASSDFTVSVAGDVPLSRVPGGTENLAVRAAKLLAQETGYAGGVHLDIYKSVPVAGGMGGGSADAAGALLACDALWGTGLSTSDLHLIGSELGADVPFALLGGTAVGVGRGDRLTPALARGRFDWVLVTDDEGLSTPEVYGTLDELREDIDISPASSTPSVPPDVLHALRAGDPELLAGAIRNDLQEAAFHLRPELAELRQEGIDAGALAGIVSGSGPTLAFLAASTPSAQSLHERLTERGYRAVLAHGAVPGARLA